MHDQKKFGHIHYVRIRTEQLRNSIWIYGNGMIWRWSGSSFKVKWNVVKSVLHAYAGYTHASLLREVCACHMLAIRMLPYLGKCVHAICSYFPTYTCYEIIGPGIGTQIRICSFQTTKWCWRLLVFQDPKGWRLLYKIEVSHELDTLLIPAPVVSTIYGSNKLTLKIGGLSFISVTSNVNCLWVAEDGWPLSLASIINCINT